MAEIVLSQVALTDATGVWIGAAEIALRGGFATAILGRWAPEAALVFVRRAGV